MPTPPLPSGIVETAVSVSDLARSCDFYTRVFAYEILQRDPRMCAYNVDGRHVLLLFLRGSDPQGTTLPWGWIPPHGANGVQHLGFSIPRESLGAWRQRLTDLGIAIESEFTWPGGGTSIYFRDPDHHLLELLTPGVWANY